MRTEIEVRKERRLLYPNSIEFAFQKLQYYTLVVGLIVTVGFGIIITYLTCQCMCFEVKCR